MITCGRPERAQDEATCPVCGQKKENPQKHVCYGCHLGLLVPAGYQRRELYRPDPVWKHPSGLPIHNATAKPPTGVGILDAPSGPRISEAILSCRHTPRIR